MEIKLNSSNSPKNSNFTNHSPIKNISSSLSTASTIAIENVLNKSETEKKSRPKISTSSISNDLIISKLDFSPKKKTLLENNNNSIKTFCRIRPFKGKNELFFKSKTDPKKLIINKENLQKLKINSNLKLINSYTFTDIFDENSTQEQIFTSTCEPLIKNLLENNQSGLIFTYGMTNAGKTFTIIGTPNQPGILPLSLTFIFNYFEEKKLFEKFELYANFIEIYNEDVFDLLANDPNGKNKFFKQKLNIKENINNIFYCQDVKYVQILNMENFNDILNLGISKKVHNATNLNINSSRSHSIFKIILRNKNIDYSNNNINEISLSIVDLAGSERAKRSETSGINLIEACKINQSLSILGKCLEAMKYNTLYVNKKLVPFRESKLTKLFCEYFQGEQNITMITNINPRKEDFEETIRALNYSCIAKEIKPVKSVLFNQTKINKRNSWNNNLNKNSNNNSFEYSKTDNKSNKNNNNENSINEEEEFIQDDNYSSIDLNLTDLDNNLIIPDNIKNNSEIAKLIEEIQNLRNEVLGLKNNNNNISSVPLLESEEQKKNKNSNNNNKEQINNNNNNNNSENNNNNPYFNNNNNNNNNDNNFQFPFNFNPNMFNPYFFNPYGFYQNFPLMLPPSNSNNNNNINNGNLSLLNYLSNLPYSNNNNVNNNLGQEIAKNLSNLPKDQKTNGVNFFFINSKFSDFRYDKNGIIPEEDENYNEENEEKINKRKNDKNNRKKNNKKKNNNKQKRKRKKKDDDNNFNNIENNFSYETPKKIEENNNINNNSNEILESNLINEEKEKSLINDKKENDFKSNILNKENFNLSFDLTSKVKKFEYKNNYKNSLLYTEPKNKYKSIFSNFKF